MARYIGPQCRLCRRQGEKLFLKGTRCETAKCSITKRKYPPGQHGWGRKKLTKYALQFREKQKLKRFYGVLEQQFKNYFRKADQKKINTGEYLLQMLERRLDNVVYLLLFASSRKHARQLVCHGHIAVNGKKVDIPSYLVKVGAVITPANKEDIINLIKTNVEGNKGRNIPSWLGSGTNGLEGHVVQLPTREDVSIHVQEQLVTDVCSR